MSGRTSRRGLFDFARRLARAEAEAETEAEAGIAEAGIAEAGTGTEWAGTETGSASAEAAGAEAGGAEGGGASGNVAPMIAVVPPAGSDDDEAAPMPPWARRAAAAAAPKPASVARVLAFACLGGSPSFCSACVEHCPIEGALELTARAPRVNADLCDGCGICERVCPAPQRAIVVLPRLPAKGPSR